MYKTRTAAIYLISNLKNGKKYIGGTTWLEHRITCHRSEIRNRNHGNSNIQRDLETGQFKLSDFSFSVLEVLRDDSPVELVTEREQFWMDKICPEYNVNDIAGKYIGDYIRTPEAIKKANDERIGRVHSKEERERRSKSLKKYYKTHKKVVSKETKKKLSEINMGENNPNWGLKRSKETKQKQSKKASRIWYTFRHSSGEEKTFNNLMGNSEKELGIPYWKARNLSDGKKDEYDGWKFVEKRDVK